LKNLNNNKLNYKKMKSKA